MFNLSSLDQKKNHPDITDLILLCRTHEILNTSQEGKLTLSKIAKLLDKNRDMFYKRVARFEKACKEDPEMAAVFGTKGFLDSAKNDALILSLEDILRAYDHIVNRQPTPETEIVVRIGAHVTVSTRILAPALRKIPETLINQIELIAGEPFTLLERDDLDLVLVTHSGEGKPPGQVDELEIHPCLLCSMDHPFSTSTFQFSWEKMADQSIVLFRDKRIHQGFSRDKIPKRVKRTVYVNTFLEAHAYALSGAGIAFSFREILGEDEEKIVTVIDLPKEETTKSRLSLLRPKGARKNRTPKAKAIIDQIEGAIQKHLEALKEDYMEAAGLNKLLKPYRLESHSTWVSGKKPNQNPTWIRNQGVRLEATSTYFVKGCHSIPSGEGKPDQNQIFGRLVRSAQDRSFLHLLWREKDIPAQRPERGPAFTAQDSVSFIFTEKDLELKKPLVGVWIGRASFDQLRTDFKPAGGSVVLQVKELSSAKLNDIINEYREANPELSILYEAKD
jgi:DNA-binding transcriptional LysR family regulator